MSPYEVDFHKKGFLVPKVVDMINVTFLLIDGLIAVSTKVLMQRHKSLKELVKCTISCKKYNIQKTKNII